MKTFARYSVLQTIVLLPFACLALAAAPAATPAPAADADAAKKAGAARTSPTVKADASVDLKLMPKGAMQKLGGYRPQQLKLSERKPASLKKAPELSSPVYGEIKFGGRSYLIVADEPKDGDGKLYVDANGNGDLTDDPETTWTKDAYQGPDGAQLTRYSGSVQLPIKAGGDKSELVSLGAYRFDNNDAQRKQLKNTLLYYSDYLYEGDLTLGGKKYHAMLADDNATGEFAPGGGTKSASRLMIDINGDGQFTPRGETFESNKPFNVKGTTWALAAPAAASGAPVSVAVSDVKVPEVALPPNHSVGQKITAFTAKRMDGKAVHFPADYKGKIVMLDFWATWCGPCMGEVDGLVSAYKEYHPQGVEILGVSLDQPNAGKKVKAVTGEKGMTWPQVYDGRFWKAEVAQKYGINSIPAAFLVDGDTGEILAAGGSLRGDNLSATLKKAVEQKGSKAGARTAKAVEPKAGEAKPEGAAPETKDEPAAAPQPAPEPAAPDKAPF